MPDNLTYAEAREIARIISDEARKRLSVFTEAEARRINGVAGHCAVATGSPAGESHQTAEAYFIDRDIFVEYVRAVLNPAREKEGLSVCTPAVASHLFDVITSRRYRQPDSRQENTSS